MTSRPFGFTSGDSLEMTITRRPLYQQAAEEILLLLRSGEWKSGEAVPSEARLAKRFGVSIATIRKAVDGLVERGYLERRQGAGTFIKTYEGHGYWNRFQRFQLISGEIAHWEDTLLSCTKALPPEAARKALGLEPDVKAWHVLRTMRANSTWTGADELWLHPEHFKRLRAADFERRSRPEKRGGAAGAPSRTSLYAFFEETYGVTISDVRDRIRIQTADAEDVALGFPPEKALLLLYRIGFTFGRVPVEYRIERVVPDGLQIVLD